MNKLDTWKQELICYFNTHTHTQLDVGESFVSNSAQQTYS